jgi:small subunit ribosomal protein S5
MEAAGVHDILSKSMGSTNQINVVAATMAALGELQDAQQKARMRGISVNRMLYGREALSG